MVLLRSKRRKIVFGRNSNGTLVTPQEFDRADFDEGWRYELIQGVLIVTPLPFRSETGPNEELGYWLFRYRDTHPEGGHLDATLPEQNVKTGPNRRRADRLIWCGLGRLPKRHERPTIIVEFTSKRKRDRDRDYRTKRTEYIRLGVKEYWVIDRFARLMTVFAKNRNQVIKEEQTYRSDLLPGFELPLAKLLAVADKWERADPEEGDEE